MNRKENRNETNITDNDCNDDNSRNYSAYGNGRERGGYKPAIHFWELQFLHESAFRRDHLRPAGAPGKFDFRIRRLPCHSLGVNRLGVSYPVKTGIFTVTPEINFQKSFGPGPEAGGLTEDKIWTGISVSF
jgi:hypothetical protein